MANLALQPASTPATRIQSVAPPTLVRIPMQAPSQLVVTPPPSDLAPLPQDKLSVPGAKLPAATTSLGFVDEGIDLAASVSGIRAQADPAARAEGYGDLMADLIEDERFEDAIGLLRTVQADLGLPAGTSNSLYRVLNQNLLESDLHDKAIELNAGWPDRKVRDEVRQGLVKYLIHEGQTIKAAQVRGEGTVAGVAKAELEALADSAKTLGKDIYELWRRNVLGVSLGERIAENARDDAEAGKKYRLKSLEYGNLACAYTISRVLDRTRLDDKVDTAECNTLHAQLKASGFSQAAGGNFKPVGRVAYQEGDIVFFTRKNKRGYGHVGVVAKVEGDKVWMVHNSSRKRQVMQVQLNTYQRPVVSVLRPPVK